MAQLTASPPCWHPPLALGHCSEHSVTRVCAHTCGSSDDWTGFLQRDAQCAKRNQHVMQGGVQRSLEGHLRACIVCPAGGVERPVMVHKQAGKQLRSEPPVQVQPLRMRKCGKEDSLPPVEVQACTMSNRMAAQHSTAPHSTSTATAQPQHSAAQHSPTLVSKLATFCRPRLLIHPVAASSRMVASTNGSPVCSSSRWWGKGSGSKSHSNALPKQAFACKRA